MWGIYDGMEGNVIPDGDLDLSISTKTLKTDKVGIHGICSGRFIFVAAKFLTVTLDLVENVLPGWAA